MNSTKYLPKKYKRNSRRRRRRDRIRIAVYILLMLAAVAVLIYFLARPRLPGSSPVDSPAPTGAAAIERVLRL